MLAILMYFHIHSGGCAPATPNLSSLVTDFSTNSKPTLRVRALQYLARREHSRAELRRKLLPHAGAWLLAAVLLLLPRALRLLRDVLAVAGAAVLVYYGFVFFSVKDLRYAVPWLGLGIDFDLKTTEGIAAYRRFVEEAEAAGLGARR